MRVWFFSAEKAQRALDQVLRGLPAVGPLRAGQPRRVGDRARAQRRRGTSARHSPAAGAIGQSAQTVRSPGTQSNGQSRPRAGAELVEAAHFYGAANAPVDERAACK